MRLETRGSAVADSLLSPPVTTLPFVLARAVRAVSVGCVTMQSERSRGLQRRLSLAGLPEDILLLICAQLEVPEWLPLFSVARFEEHFLPSFLHGGISQHPLIDLSGTCRSLRRLCVPRIFRFIYLDDSHGFDFWPTVVNRGLDVWPSTFSHTRGILLNSRGVASQNLPDLLGLTKNLRDVYFQNDVTLLPAMLQHPELEVLGISEPMWESIQPSLPLQSFSAPLRELRVCARSRPKAIAHGQTGSPYESEWIEGLVSRLRPMLEVLVLPANSVRISFLASATWPRLRELVLHGCSPISDAPLSMIFDVLPRLRVFALTIAVRRHETTPVLLPESAHDSPNLDELRRFMMSSPSLHDGIFARLPPELEGLSLRDMPRFYQRSRFPDFGYAIDEAYDPRILSCGEALRIFRSLRCCAALRHLELVVFEDEHELELLAYIAETCPRLTFLELHCYRNVWDYASLLNVPLIMSLVDLATALSAFRALRVVRLNLDLPWSQFCISEHCELGLHNGVSYAGVIAQAVAQAVPWLDAICVLTLDGRHKWRMWSVRRDDRGVRLERLTLTGRDSVVIGQAADF